MTDFLVIGLLLAVSFLVGGNNASVAAGAAVGARVINRRSGLLLTSAGYVIGLLLEGDKLERLRAALLPNPTETAILLVLIVSILVFILADVQRAPASLTYAVVGSLVGLSLAGGSVLDLNYLAETVALWFAGPLAVLLLSAGVARILAGKSSSPWKLVQVFRIGIVAAVFYSAYALGANTLGAIVSIVPDAGQIQIIAVGLAAMAGAFILGSGPISRVGEELYALGYSSAFLSQALGATIIELSTQAGIPLSASRIVTSSTLGVGLSRPVRLLNPKTVVSFAGAWFAVPLIALALSFILGHYVTL